MLSIEKLTRARAGLVLSAPFYATIALGCELVERADIETMATDGIRIFFNAEFVAGMTDAETRGVIAHEVMHIANLHHVRRGSRDPAEWNRACDYAINPQLIAEGFALPSGVLNESRYAGMSAEQIFSELVKDRQQDSAGKPQDGTGQNGAGKPQDGAGKPQDGTGAGQGSQGHGIGGVIDAAPASDPAALQAAELDAMARVMQAAQAAARAGQESAAGSLAADQIRKPKIDWQTVLRRFVDSAAKTEYSWSRPNRRFIASGQYLPGKIKDGMQSLGVLIDVSGSIDKAALTRFLSELNGACEDALPEHVRVIQCDTKVCGDDEFLAGEQIEFKLRGGGGTDLQPALDLLSDCSAVLIFTDCIFPREVKEISAPCLWVKWGTRGTFPKWGEGIQI